MFCKHCGVEFDVVDDDAWDSHTENIETGIPRCIEALRATIEAKDAEIAGLNSNALRRRLEIESEQRRADAAEARAKELEDLLKRSNKAARLEDLDRIAELELELVEAKDRLREVIGERDTAYAEVKDADAELAEAKRDTARLIAAVKTGRFRWDQHWHQWRANGFSYDEGCLELALDTIDAAVDALMAEREG